MSVLLEFLEFINGGPQPAVKDLLHRVLVKSRKLTAAEAGAIYIVRGQGRKKMVNVASLQNALHMAAADLFDNATLDRARHYLVQCRRNPSLGFVCFTCQRNQLQSRFLRDAWRTTATLTLAQALRTVLCDALAPRADRLHRYTQFSSDHRIRMSEMAEVVVTLLLPYLQPDRY